MATTVIHPFTQEDVSAVADIHVKIYYGTREPASDGLQAYYRGVFLHNPWRELGIPSLVYRSNEGKAIGFVGVIPRRMICMGREIKAAVIHRIMADPNRRTPFVGSRLMRRVLDGPQDLSMADGANDRGRAMWEATGGSVSYLHSMNWIRPLRPFSYGTTLLAKKKGCLGRSAFAFRPFSRLVDWIAAYSATGFLRPSPPANVGAVELTSDLLFRCYQRFAENYLLYPSYDSQSIQWVWEFLKDNRERGKLKGVMLYDKKDHEVGGYLYYLSSNGIGELMFMAAAKKRHNEVASHLLNHAWQQGAVCIGGRVESKFMGALWAHNALIKRGSWAIFHARDESLLNIINRGDAFISALDGELLFRSPHDRL